jgi:hypothetical protein
VNNLDEPITLSDLRCNNASFKVELKETKPGREFDLHVTALPPFTNATVFGSITLKTSSTNAPLLSVSAYAMVQQTVVVSPQQITLPAGPLKTPVSTSVLIRNNSTNSLAVSDVRLELPGVDVKVAEPQTGRVYSVTMTFPVGFQLPPDQKPALMMKSSHPRFAEIKVPVLQLKPVAAATAPAGAPPGPLRTPTPLLPAIPVSVPPLGGDPAK